jgi:hypothetical protein
MEKQCQSCKIFDWSTTSRDVPFLKDDWLDYYRRIEQMSQVVSVRRDSKQRSRATPRSKQLSPPPVAKEEEKEQPVLEEATKEEEEEKSCE